VVKIKPLDKIKAAYKDAATRVPTRYKEGIAATTGWKDKAIAGEALWAAKMREAIAAERRRKALEAVSEEEWKKKALELGAARIGPGMAANVDKHAKNYAPYREALAGLELPPREADPMANIDNRLKAVVRTLVEKKKELKG